MSHSSMDAVSIESDLSPQGEIVKKSCSNRRINFDQLCDLKTYLKLFGHENYNKPVFITDIISDNPFRVIQKSKKYEKIRFKDIRRLIEAFKTT